MVKISKKPSFSVSLESITYGGKESTPTKIKSDFNKGFSDKCDYYITLTELLWKIQKNGENLSDTSRPILFSADFIRVKKRKGEVEYHRGVRIKYIACVVNRKLKFDKLEKRAKVVECEDDSDNVVYFIPIHFLRSVIPSTIGRTDNLSAEIGDIGIFKYTGDIDMFRSMSIFSLSKKIYLAKKINTKNYNINILV